MVPICLTCNSSGSNNKISKNYSKNLEEQISTFSLYTTPRIKYSPNLCYNT